MLGAVLLYVGIVLFSNGVSRLQNVNAKSVAIMNLFTGTFIVILDIASILMGQTFAGATGLLFGFTYLYVGINNLIQADQRPYGWYSLFVTVNTIPIGIMQLSTDWRMAVIWWAWGVLWFFGWVESVLKKPLPKFVGSLGIIEGILTAWVPGMFMLFNKWDNW